MPGTCSQPPRQSFFLIVTKVSAPHWNLVNQMRRIRVNCRGFVLFFTGLLGDLGWCSFSDNTMARANSLLIVILAGNQRHFLGYLKYKFYYSQSETGSELWLGTRVEGVMWTRSQSRSLENWQWLEMLWKQGKHLWGFLAVCAGLPCIQGMCSWNRTKGNSVYSFFS